MAANARFDFHYGPRLVVGPGESAKLGELLPSGRCLFVTDGVVRSIGLATAALDSLARVGIEAVLFDEVEPDPSLETLLRCVAAGEGCSAVVGFGGGSPMDVAKLAAYLIGSGDSLDRIWGVGMATGSGLPLALVPTTAGTGSEATAVSVITVSGSLKNAVNSPALLARWAVLDPELTTGLPRHVTAATGIDAMVHAIEAYTSAKRKNPLSDLLAREALKRLSSNLITVCEEPENLAARTEMLVGAHLAGVAFNNAPVAGVHALAYPLGGHFHVPHGLSNALVLAPVLSHNMASAMTLYAELGCVLDPSLEAVGAQAGARGLIEHMARLSRQSGLPQRLADVGVGSEHLDMLATEAMKQERLLVNNPCPITRDDARRIYESAL